VPWGAVLSVFLVLIPCLVLALDRGGTRLGGQVLAFSWIFVALAAWSVAQLRRGRGSWPPAGAALLLIVPLAQLVPVPAAVMSALAPERAEELRRFAEAGIAPAPTLSLYPYATVRAWLALAAAVALYLLCRDLCRRTPAALEWLAAGVLALGLCEALPALRQYLATQAAGAGAAELARGTFGNRNLLAAFLEGCYGVALGVLAGRLEAGQRDWRRPGAMLLAALAALTAGAAGVAILVSFSRMGIVSLGVATLAMGLAVCRGGLRRARWLAAVVVAVALAAAAVGLPGLAERYTLERLAREKDGRMAMWKDSLEAARRYFPAGAGAGAFPYAFRRSRPYLGAYTIDHPHNEYLETAVEWGAPAAAAIALGLAWALWRRVRRLWDAPSERRWIGLGCAAGMAAILTHAAVDFPLRIPAILALFAVLMGMSEAAAPALAPAAGRAAAATTAAAAAALAAASLWWAPPADGSPGRLERWNAEAHYRLARSDFEQGRGESAEAGYRRALERNPYAAVLWTELAQLAEARGDGRSALASSDLARHLEPHTRRGLWAAANLRLRLGAVEEASLLLGAWARQAPENRRAAWEILWGANLEPRRILDTLPAGDADALYEYCLYLLERRRWDPLAEAAARGLDPLRLRNVFDWFFQGGAGDAAVRLWAAAAGGEPGFANGSLEQPLRGWGLDWVAWPVDRVRVERRREDVGYRLDVEFLRPGNIDYSGLTHDFAVSPGRQYRLRLEARAEAIESASGPAVEVISHRRRLAISEAFRRTTPWRAVELRFRPAADERLCRLRVIRQPTSRFDNRIGGRLSLRRASLDPDR
jgi:hypothetical protein